MSKLKNQVEKELEQAIKKDPEKFKDIQAETDLITKAYGKELEGYTAGSYVKLLEIFKTGDPSDLMALTYAIVGATFTEGYKAKQREIEKEGGKHELTRTKQRVGEN